MKLLLGKMEEQLASIEDNSIDSIVTDPPYGLSFMNKRWDYQVPTTDQWKHCMRVLKPGGHLIAFSGARTYHRMAVAIEDAGFEIRDQIMWIYGSGFPKSHNVGKKDKRFEGWGTALKPAHEPIVLARKPLSEKTVVDNCIKWGVGALNIDASMIPGKTLRWPANFIHDGQVCDEPWDRFFYIPKVSKKDRNEGLDENASELMKVGGTGVEYKDSRAEEIGFKSSDARQLFDEKAKQLKEAGILANTHPTVKPTDLMFYLIRLVTPEGGVVLDPFMGSGSTGKAAIRNGYDFIGIEMEEDSFNVAKARIDWEINK